MRLACFELQDWQKEYLKQKFEGHIEMSFHNEVLNRDNVVDFHDVEGLVIFIYSQITKEILDNLPNLKFIATMSTGYDHIDIEECKARNIVVSTVPTYGENTVAEHTFALIFAISRRLIESYERVRQANFSPIGLTGFDLFGRTIGVVGVGNIGTHVIRIARGIGMDVLGYKRTPDEKLSHELGFSFVDLDTLYAKSDIITLHLPHTSETHHFLNKEAFAKMKDGVVIINTSRGSVVDTGELLEAIHSGKVAAAGLDVLEEEPLLREEQELLHKDFAPDELMNVLESHILLNNKKVLITPHNAFNSREALQRILKTTEENISGYVSGNPQNTAY